MRWMPVSRVSVSCFDFVALRHAELVLFNYYVGILWLGFPNTVMSCPGPMPLPTLNLLDMLIHHPVTFFSLGLQ
jgi:hypothetical protein